MPEDTNIEKKPRIGVFICHCGSNIGGFVDVKAVTEYASTLPDVVYATDNLYTCAEDGLNNIKESIKEHNLDRVVVSSCTPRTHAPLFQRTCEAAGVNKYMFTFVNIREHCSWVHMKEKEKATQKAKDLVRMGVARARFLEPQEETKIDVTPAALVVGGGVAGMTAALSLANMGFPVHLVEKEKELGGFVKNLHGLMMTKKSANEAIQPLIDKVNAQKNITQYVNSHVATVEGFIGNYDVSIGTEGSESKEVKVGAIIVATGAIPLVPEGLFGYKEHPNVVTSMEFEELCNKKEIPKLKSVAFIQCAGARGQKVSYCSRICCNVAIKTAINIAENRDNMLGATEEKAEAEAGQVVEEPAAEMKAEDEGLERRRRRRGRGRREADEAADEGGAPSSGVEITVFNRDVMAYGVEHELEFNKAREKRVKFIRYLPDNLPKVSTKDGKLEVGYFHETLKMERTMPVDMVILSTPLVSQPDAATLSQLLKVPLGQDGFFQEAHVKLRPVDFATDGVYVCGTCRGPADIAEAASQASAAASRAAIPLANGYVQAEALTSRVDETKCTGCGTCVEVCPYGALRKNDDGISEVIVAACKGCGCCGATCPEGAITMTHYTDQQLLAEAKAALEEV
ncbi:MAG: CoB--CoM heterodisulfide reductase iron-sulfur subunit A family protein [Methanobacteriota archaeon]|nr:MAG: CoB--CoM heterodisulfide reductase iron-sulfur subunit A family protein [Euryarchaeota archaeon]